LFSVKFAQLGFGTCGHRAAETQIRWADRMIRPYTSVVALIVLVACCGWEQPTGRVESGSVKIICGQANRPCNFHIVAPKELIRASVSLDGQCILPMFPSHIEHPYRTLLLTFLGVEPSSDTAVATFHVPAGEHALRIEQPGWDPIERRIISHGSRKQIEIELRPSDLRKAKS
jgi:hypothetical protein